MFKFEDLINDYTVVHCKTVDQVRTLFKEADKYGLTWRDGERYTANDYYNSLWINGIGNICFNLFDGCVGSLSYFMSKREIVIVEFNEICFDQVEVVDDDLTDAFLRAESIKLLNVDCLKKYKDLRRIVLLSDEVHKNYQELKSKDNMISELTLKIKELETKEEQRKRGKFLDSLKKFFKKL